MSRLTGDWNKGRKLFRELPRLLKANIEQATKRNSVLARDQIKRTIRNGRPEWPAVSGLTKKFKGSSKPLVDHNDLMQGIESMRIAPAAFFVGVPRNKGMLVIIAAVHEYGKTIRPVKAKALAIPVSRFAKEQARRYGGVGNIPGLFRPKGKKILALSAGFKGIVPMFILMKQTVIPPRPFIEPSFRDARHRMKREWEWAIISALRGKRYVRRS